MAVTQVREQVQWLSEELQAAGLEQELPEQEEVLVRQSAN